MCAGISLMMTVCASWPPRSPSVCDWPWCIAVRPCRFGSANVVRPSPPYVVPSSAKSGWFWLIGRVWPLHSAHPLGAKLNDMILISLKKGVPISVSSLRPRRVYALEGDAVVEGEIRHEVVVRLAPARHAHHRRVHHDELRGRGVRVDQLRRGIDGDCPARRDRTRVVDVGITLHRVAVCRHLGREQRDEVLASGLSDGELAERAVARVLRRVHGAAALQVGQGERRLAVAAVERSDEREHCGVLGDGHELTVAERPPFGGEVERKDTDLADEWIRHQVGLGKTPNSEMINVIARYGCMLSCGWLPP